MEKLYIKLVLKRETDKKLQLIVWKLGRRTLTMHLAQDRAQWNLAVNMLIHTILGILLAEILLAFKEGLYSMDTVHSEMVNLYDERVP
jgi:hypothetical protein